ncbi:hypothetical protein C8R46DRAFT_1109789 [Mycena filopes]|nr:hypothetical protein C8R46DRAFT_1109789 [Mycena filopes]
MGVKSLWKLLAPVGRPVMLETMEGQIMAIDSSIWIYQFQATMRDNDGKALSNAHVLGFLRRIAKLLFYGIRPVFVFDGAAPALKRNTLNERRKKKSGAATSHVKLAEKLLAAQLRREALKHAKGAPYAAKRLTGPVVLDDNTVYLEDIDPSMPKTPARNPTATPSPIKPKFHDHDPYHLPDVDLEAAVAKATRTAVPDPRLATEDELRETEVQYEIVGDLRLKSRQTSYARLQNMLKFAPTPLDFSKQQIQNLRQRNTLTQQLLMTTDSMGKANLTIPVRVASERNREYVLIDQDPKVVPEDDSDEDMEEVPIPTAGVPDADLQEYQRSMHLAAIANRHVPKKPTASRKAAPLFDLDDVPDIPPMIDDEDDGELALAIQESIDQANEARQATARPRRPVMVNAVASSSKLVDTTPHRPSESVSRFSFHDDDGFVQGNRLELALSIANAGPVRTPTKPAARPFSSMFGEPVLLQTTTPSPAPPRAAAPSPLPRPTNKPVPPSPLSRPIVQLAPPTTRPEPELNEVVRDEADSIFGAPVLLQSSTPRPSTPLPSSDDEMKEVLPTFEPTISNPVPDRGMNNAAVVLADAVNDDDPFVAGEVATEPTQVVVDRAFVEPLQNSPPSTPQNDVVDDEPISDWTSSPVAEDWDAAQEMDPDAEEGEFARFMSQVKGKDLDDVRQEIDDEIKVLHAQKKAAMRDSEDINQQMISQIMTMLGLFGIPYITAPMEAEAQCAELVHLGLVNGVITDDSDVFLFGSQRVFKNMFNQSKTVRELGLDRDTLIRLAYLLGSDYVEGLPGVGPVVAMELLDEFPGEDGLHKFKDWWTKKKKFKDLYLQPEWPNPIVRDAYYHPTVDESDEPFKWGLPDLDALREFLYVELSCLLLPVIQKIRKRGQNGALNKQGNLDGFFDITGSGTIAPRKRQAYASKRLQQVVSDFRKKRKHGSKSPSPAETSQSEHEEDVPVKKKAKAGKAKAASAPKRATGRGRGGKKGSSRKKVASEDEAEFQGVQVEAELGVGLSAQLRPRPKPAYKGAEVDAAESIGEE